MNTCYVCNSNNVSAHKKKEPFTILICKKCGLKWVDKASENEISIYDKTYFNNRSKIGYKNYLLDEKNHRKNARRILNSIGKIKKLSNLKILDIGCAFGYLLDEARKTAGCQAKGVELSSYAYEYAKSNLKLDILNSKLKIDSFPAQTFDIVFMIGTIEHLATPKEILSIVKHVIKPGGLLIITTINTKGLFPLYALKPPEHLFYFNHRNLTHILKSTGFEVLKIRTHFTSYYLYDIIHKLGEFTCLKPLSFASRVTEKLLPRLNLNIPTNEMFVIAKAIDHVKKN